MAGAKRQAGGSISSSSSDSTSSSSTSSSSSSSSTSSSSSSTSETSDTGVTTTTSPTTSVPTTTTTSSQPTEPTDPGGPITSPSDVPQTSSTSSTISILTMTTVITTNAEGQTVTTIQETRIAAPTTRTGPSSGSHTGAIVGGAVGGIVALIGFIILLWVVLRRRGRDEFDGNFDPDVVGGRSQGRADDDMGGPSKAIRVGAASGGGRGGQQMLDLGDGGSVITPFYMPNETGVHGYRGDGYAGMPGVGPRSLTSGGHGSDEPYAEGYQNPSPPLLPVGGPGVPGEFYAYDRGGPRPNPSLLTDATHTTSYSVPSSKEREAFANRARAAGGMPGPGYSQMGVVNAPATASDPSEVGSVIGSGNDSANGAGSVAGSHNRSASGSAGGVSSPVMVHQDAGRVPIPETAEPGPDLAEIPPTYDSIAQ